MKSTNSAVFRIFMNIPPSWKVCTVEDICEINPTQINNNYPHSEIEYIDISSVSHRRLESIQVLPLSIAPSRAKRIVKSGDTIISTVRPNRKSYLYIKDANPNTVVSTGFAVIRPFAADSKYVHYVLTSDPFIDLLSAIADTSTSCYPAVNPIVIVKTLVPLPPQNEQRRIGEILGSLDDKIELNRQMNKTLEAMATAIFKSWFIDFEPFQYNEFVNSDLGPIPKGWNVGHLGDVAEIVKETVKPNENPNTFYLHYSFPAFDGGKMPNLEQGCNIKSNKYLVRSDFVLVSRLNPDTPRVWRPLLKSDIPSICSTEFITIQTLNPNLVDFVYGIVTTPIFWDFMLANVTGTTGSRQRVDFKEVLDFPVVIPSREVLKEYCQIVKSLYFLTQQNLLESRFLAQIRDALLPKLLSGKINVSDVEINVRKHQK